MAPLANYPIISGRLIQLCRHLKHQNPFFILDSIARAGIVQKFRRSWMIQISGVVILFMAPREVEAPFKNGPIILGDQYS